MDFVFLTEFVSSLPKEMTEEVTGIEGEEAGTDEIGEIVIEEGNDYKHMF